MGRIFNTTQTTSAQGSGGRIFGASDNSNVQPISTPKSWEKMSFGEKLFNTAKEVPKTLYNFIPPSIREAIEKPTVKNVILAAPKGAAEFGATTGGMIVNAAAGGPLAVVEKLTGKPQKYEIPGVKKIADYFGLKGVPSEISSYQQQAGDLVDQGFSPTEAATLVGINAYLGLMPVVKFGAESAAGRNVVGRIFQKEVPLSETPEGIKMAEKGQIVPETTKTVERAPVTSVKKIFGKTEEQQKFSDLIEESMDKYFQGRQDILSKEDPLNKSLIKLNNDELKAYSEVTQGLKPDINISDNLRSAIDLWKKTNQEIETDLIKRGKITAEQAENRRWKPVETITGRSRDELKAMGVEPIYYPYLAEDLLKKSDFIASTGKRTRGGYLKRFTGKLLQDDSYIKDPKVAIPRNRIQVFRDKINDELVDSVRENFAENDPAIIEKLKNDPNLADRLGLEEWKPSGRLKFYKQTVNEVVGRGNEKLPEFKPQEIVGGDKVGDLSLQIQNYEEALKSNPAAALEKYANKKTGELPEVLGEGKGFKKTGDDIASELGFSDSEQARLAYEQYRIARDNLNGLKEKLKTTKGKTFKDFSEGQLKDINNSLQTAGDVITRQKTIIGVSKKVETYWVPKEIAKELNKFYRPGAVEKALRLTYDPAIDMWRVSVLGMVPRWVYNNFMGNTIMAIAGKTDPLAFFRSAKEMFARTKIGEKLNVEKGDIPEGVFGKNYAGGEMTKVGQLGGLPRETSQFLKPVENWLNLLEQAKNYKALRIPAIATQNLIKGWIALGKPLGRLNRTVENWFRGAIYISKTEGKFLGFQLDKPVPPAEGLKYVNEFLFDYSKLTRTERATFRRALPFYNWMKNITEFAFKFPYNHPTRGLVAGALLQEYVDYINDVNQKDDKSKSTLRIKTTMRYQGKPMYINIKSAIPFSDIFNNIPTNPEKLVGFLTDNPISKIIIERGFKLNTFTGQPFTQPAAKQQFDEYGKPIPALPSLPSHIAQQFPQTKLIQDASDYLKYGRVIKRYETGEPKVFQGKIQTSDLLMDIFGYFGIKVSSAEYDRLKSQVDNKNRNQDIKGQQYDKQVETRLKNLKPNYKADNQNNLSEQDQKMQELIDKRISERDEKLSQAPSDWSFGKIKQRVKNFLAELPLIGQVVEKPVEIAMKNDALKTYPVSDTFKDFAKEIHVDENFPKEEPALGLEGNLKPYQGETTMRPRFASLISTITMADKPRTNIEITEPSSSTILHEMLHSWMFDVGLPKEWSQFAKDWEDSKKSNPILGKIDRNLFSDPVYKDSIGDSEFLAGERFAWLGELLGRGGIENIPENLRDYYKDVFVSVKSGGGTKK